MAHIEDNIDIIRIKLGKYALSIKMKFAIEAGEKIAWTADEHMVCCNLLSMMVQHWTHAHKLNGYLMELVRALSIGYRTANRPLNPLASECACKQNDTNNMKPNTGEKTNNKDEHSTND